MSSFKPWQVLDLSMDEPIPDLPADPSISGVYAVIWWHDIPLGHLELSASMLPVPASYLTDLILTAVTPAVGDHLLDRGFRAPLPMRGARSDCAPDYAEMETLRRPMEQLRDRFGLSEQRAARTISVVVCTRERPEALERCLRSLDDLSVRPDEIIVVDNAPRTDATLQLVRSRPNITYVLEARPGLSKARNAGLQHASGEIIAFTDDDVEVHPDWLMRLQQGFSDPDVMAVTGLVLTAEIETPAQLEFHRGGGGFGWGFRAITFDETFFQQTKARGVPVWHIGAGSNMAFRRRVFSRIGTFDERLGAGASGCSEDSEMWYRVLAHGLRCRYEPTSVVYHYHRREMRGLNEQMYQYMRGHVTALLIQFERFGHPGNLCRAFGILPVYYGRLTMRRVFRSRKPHMKTLRAQMLGSAAGLLYYWRCRGAARSGR